MARTPRSENSETSPVRLKPILSIAPTTYVPVALGVALLLILFFLFLYPGLRHYGSEVTFRTTPAGAEVVVDGVRVGAAPVTAFVEAGEREILIQYPGFESRRETVSVGGRLVGSLLASRKQRYSARLTPSGVDRLAQERLEAFARWAMAGAGSAAFPVPPILAETSRALSSYTDYPAARQAAARMLETGEFHLATETQLKDYIRGRLFFHGQGGVTPVGIGRSVQELIHLVNDSQSAAATQELLDRLLPGSLLESFRQGGWYDTGRRLSPFGEEAVRASMSGRDAAELPSRVTVEGMTFLSPSSDRPFLLMEREVTRADYAAFLGDRPAWGPDNRQELLESGAVTEDYLADWATPRSSAEPLRFVSWDAATAFAEWLTSRLNAEYPELRGVAAFRLPREREWLYAASFEPAPAGDGAGPVRVTFESSGENPLPVSRERRSGNGFYDIYGNLWEWTESWYSPSPEAAYFDPGLRETPLGAERVVRGGSFANSLRDIGGSPRGSQPGAWCSPYLGFRLVLAPVQE